MFPSTRVFALAITLAVSSVQCVETCAQTDREVGNVVDRLQPIRIEAAHREVWREAAADGSMVTTVTTLLGSKNADGLVRLTQGTSQLSGETMVVVDTATPNGRDVYVYAEDRVEYIHLGTRRSAASKHLRLRTMADVQIKVVTSSETDQLTHRMQRAIQRMDPQRSRVNNVSLSSPSQAGPQNAQQTESTVSQPSFLQLPQIGQQLSGGFEQENRRIRVRPRSSQQLRLDSFVTEDTTPKEKVYVLNGGVNIVIEGVTTEIQGRQVNPGVLDLSADHVVIWTLATDSSLSPDNDLIQNKSERFQVYLEGNVVVRQGESRITASHAFFDANTDRAMLMNAELRAVQAETGVQIRVRAEKLRQLSRDRFHAKNAWTTTSPYGVPGYRLEASDIFVEPGPISPFTELNPNTGLPKSGRMPLWVTAQNSRFVFGDIPLLSFPQLTFPAEDPNIPIRSATIKQDRIFGFQVKTVWNLTKILGQRKVRGMQWDLNADFLSKRGPSVGVVGDYDVMNAYGRGTGDANIIYNYDDGTDNMGLGRQSVPTDNHRGIINWRHRQRIDNQTLVFGELGYLTDRNYLESFHEPRWDAEKDVETIIGARRDSDAWSGRIFGKVELNDFETTTEWLPRADLYSFSQPIVPGYLYLTSHSSVGYARQQPAQPTNSPADPFTPLGMPYVGDYEGVAAMTRARLDSPFFLGPVKVNPFVMGEAAYWGDGPAGSQDRYVVSGGVQANLTAMRAFPEIRDELWNVNGLAHKSDLTLEYRMTDVSTGLNSVPQLNDLDDNSQERFRGRYPLQIFSGLIPPEFDPRFYAVRAGAGLSVAAPYHEAVADQQTLKLRWRNRLQTKVGGPGYWRIRDWMTWESGVTWFPDKDRDNFGEDFGMIYGNYAWNINDRTSILANGIFDLFDNSQDVWSVGLLSQRSTRGSLYLGFRQVEAKNYLESQTLVASYSYLMSPKWISTGQISYDIAAGESRGSSLTFSRIGLDFVIHFGFGIDTSKDNVGAAISIEPRFGPPTPTNLSYLLGLER